MPIPAETLAQIRQNIKDAETALKEMELEVNKARTAGLDVIQETKDMEALKQQIRQLKAVYGRG